MKWQWLILTLSGSIIIFAYRCNDSAIVGWQEHPVACVFFFLCVPIFLCCLLKIYQGLSIKWPKWVRVLIVCTIIFNLIFSVFWVMIGFYIPKSPVAIIVVTCLVISMLVKVYKASKETWSMEGMGGKDAAAVKWYRKFAEQGDVEAQYCLGLMYLGGKGALQDDREAAKCFRKAAEQGDIFAQKELGRMYEKGKGVPQDDREAAQWYSKATEGRVEEREDAFAQFRRGLDLLRHTAVAQDYKEAAKCFRKAAEQGDIEAPRLLNEIYLQGKVVPDAHYVKEEIKWWFYAVSLIALVCVISWAILWCIVDFMFTYPGLFEGILWELPNE